MAALDLPDFLQYLFSSKPKFDCYFEVWNQDKPERIGAVKLMLMAHSQVFRTQLEESELKEENVPIKDIHPDTFKGMLKYVYGQDNTPDMSFDEADNLLYVAEKYMMKTFKDKLATRLMKLLDRNNIFSLLNNPACYTHLQLDAAITDILKLETDHVLASPQFPLMSAEHFLRILEQDGLAVVEIDLWRAAIKWAKHRAKSEDGKLLRQQISGFSSHLRLCSLAANELSEVISSGVLSTDEINTACLYKGIGEKPVFEELSNITEPRKKCNGKQIKKFYIYRTNDTNNLSSYIYSFKILTRNFTIELFPLECWSKSRDKDESETWTIKFSCITTITKEPNPYNTDSSSTKDPPTIISFSTDVKLAEQFKIPLEIGGKNIILEPNTVYSIKMELTGHHEQFYNDDEYNLRNHCNHFELYVPLKNACYRTPFIKLEYRVLT